MCGQENMESIYDAIAPLLVINGLAWALSHNTRLVYQLATFELAAIQKFPTINGH